MSFADPYTFMKKWITALMNGNNVNWDDKIMDSIMELGMPFFGPDIAAGAIFELASNKKFKVVTTRHLLKY